MDSGMVFVIILWPPFQGAFLFLAMFTAPQLQSFMQLHSNAENKAAMEAYMKNKFRFFGIKSVQRKALFREFLNQHPPQKGNRAQMIEFVGECWKLPERELHYCALEWMIRQHKLWQENDLEFFESLVTHQSWWDTVDSIASNVFGPWFRKYPEMIQPTIDRWMAGDNIWLWRCCLLFQLKYKSKTDPELLTDVILKLCDSREFFIRKAIGWILREYAKTDPEFVIHFAQQHSLQPLSYREALKHLQ